MTDTTPSATPVPPRRPSSRVRARTIHGPSTLFAAMLLLALAACAPQPATRLPEAPSASVPKEATSPSATERGGVSHYGHAFAGRKTASGEIFDPEAMTMAHRTLPFGTRVKVTNLENRQSVDVVVNDRGPFVRGRVADLSLGAARRIGMVEDGVVDGILEITAPAKGATAR